MPKQQPLTGENLLGASTLYRGSKVFRAVDPTTGLELETEFSNANPDSIAFCVDLAAQAFSKFSELPTNQRAEFLEAIATGIDELGDPLLIRAHSESALPIARLTGERARTVAQLRMFSNLIREGSWVGARIDHAIADRQPVPKPDIRRMLKPIGPVAVFGASNFPFAFSVAGGDTASALAAGCPVIVKAHPAHPGTSELVARAVLLAAKKTGMPDGVFSMIHADHAGAAFLVRHPKLSAVGFTGSLSGGRALYDAAAQRQAPIPVFAEMGSVNPVFLMPNALNARADSLAAGYVASLTMGVGQFCTNPGVVVGISSPGWKQFVDGCAAVIANVGKGIMLTESIGSSYKEAVRLMAESKKLRMLSGSALPGSPSLFLVRASVVFKHPKLLEEVFGPCGLLIECETLEEILEIARLLEGQLTATIQYGAEDVVSNLAFELMGKVGRLVFNGFPTGVEVCPSMHHGGPYPASTDSRFTSVGTAAIERWVRPICYQDCPDELLPDELKEINPKGIARLVDGSWAATS